MKNRKRAIRGMAVWLCVVLSGFHRVPVQAASEEKTYREYLAGEVRTEEASEAENLIQISIRSEADLLELAENCALDSWSVDKYVVLDRDIFLSEGTELMIPTFGGIFDGCGHAINGLRLDETGSAIGLFRYLQQGAVVRNLVLSGSVCPEGSQCNVGMLAGVNYGKITNCFVAGSIVGKEAVGGIVGSNEAAGEIRRCSSKATVNGEHYVGGICGKNSGTLNNCINYGKVNAYSMEVPYHIEDITAENVESFNSAENMAAHTDTGGIAGYSDGKIYYCSNSGTVGYQHVGYNTGGIVGRLHQGYLQNCTNSGAVFGRKDVGGIAGQMEPFLEIQYLDDKLKEIDRETEKFLDLVEQSGEELHRTGKQASDLAKSLSTNLKEASAAAGRLSSVANELWYIYNQELTGIGNDLDRLNQELEEQDTQDREEGNTTDHVIGEGEEGEITITVPNDMESYRAALRRFADSTGDHLANMGQASTDRSGVITENLNTLNDRMEAAGSELEQLAAVLEQGVEQGEKNRDALVNQARVLRKSISELRDDLFRYEGISVEDASDEEMSEDAQTEELGNPDTQKEEAYYDISSFQKGKITLCVNRGVIQADTNVGGIVGQISTELDFDPEDDIELTGEESFNIEQTVKAVVRECRNQGEITAKKDYVGGIVGKADHGAVIECESFGGVKSTGGSYVGGIVGLSGYTVRSCCFLGDLSGKNNVGGIVGKGCDIFSSVAYPTLEITGERGGSIAGQLSEDGMIAGNLYVQGGLPGVDSIGYEGGATPMEYEELCSQYELPEGFTSFTVCFLADGEELASYSCKYGDSLEQSMIPTIPEKEGYFGAWPQFDYGFIRGNRILEAEYIPWISSIAGENTDEDGRPLVLVQGQFLPGADLRMTEHGAERTLEIVYLDEEGHETGHYEDPVKVRLQLEDPEHSLIEVYAEEQWRTVDCETIGRYQQFSMEKPGIFRVTIVEDHSRIEVLVIGASVIAGLCLCLLIRKAIKKIRDKRRRKALITNE